MSNSDDELDVSKELKRGDYLKKADVEAGPLTFGVKSVDWQSFDARDGKPAEKRLVLTLDGDPVRKLALNKTNLEVFADAWGPKAKYWVGCMFDAFFDPNVFMHGKRTGGLRVTPRSVSTTVATPVRRAVPAAVPVSDRELLDDPLTDDDPVPF